MTILGVLSYSLRLEFLSLAKGTLITQRHYTKEMLAEFGLKDCRSVPTSMLKELKLLPNMGAVPADINTYQRMVEKLIFLANT